MYNAFLHRLKLNSQAKNKNEYMISVLQQLYNKEYSLEKSDLYKALPKAIYAIAALFSLLTLLIICVACKTTPDFEKQNAQNIKTHKIYRKVYSEAPIALVHH